MSHENIKILFADAVRSVVSDISRYSIHPEKDFIRNKKLPPDKLITEKDPLDVMKLLCKELIPIRDERQYPRLQTAHFRRPRYFIYRAA